MLYICSIPILKAIHVQLIEALECHVSAVRSTLRKKLKKKASQSAIAGLEPRHSSMAVEVRPYLSYCVRNYFVKSWLLFGLRDLVLLLGTITVFIRYKC